MINHCSCIKHPEHIQKSLFLPNRFDEHPTANMSVHDETKYRQQKMVDMQQQCSLRFLLVSVQRTYLIRTKSLFVKLKIRFCQSKETSTPLLPISQSVVTHTQIAGYYHFFFLERSNNKSNQIVNLASLCNQIFIVLQQQLLCQETK